MTGHRTGDQRRHVTDIAKRPLLASISKNTHRLFLHGLVHEDADHIAVAVANILLLAVHIVRPKNNVVQSEHPVRDVKFLLDGRDTARELGVKIELAYGGDPVERVLTVSGVSTLFERAN